MRSQVGIAPGFTSAQQALVADLMRLNLFATLLFSLAGMMTAGLQANQHFLLPALAPIMYDIGMLFGVLVLSPEQGYSFGPVTLPAFGLGIHGLVYGTILGAFLYMAIQVPGLLRFHFRWSPSFGLHDSASAASSASWARASSPCSPSRWSSSSRTTWPRACPPAPSPPWSSAG